MHMLVRRLENSYGTNIEISLWLLTFDVMGKRGKWSGEALANAHVSTEDGGEGDGCGYGW